MSRTDPYQEPVIATWKIGAANLNVMTLVTIIGNDEKTPVAVSARELTLLSKEAKGKDGSTVPAMTVKLLPKDEANGKATQFVGTDPGLGKVTELQGTVLAELDGKPSQGEF